MYALPPPFPTGPGWPRITLPHGPWMAQDHPYHVELDHILSKMDNVNLQLLSELLKIPRVINTRAVVARECRTGSTLNLDRRPAWIGNDNNTC